METVLGVDRAGLHHRVRRDEVVQSVSVQIATVYSVAHEGVRQAALKQGVGLAQVHLLWPVCSRSVEYPHPAPSLRSECPRHQKILVPVSVEIAAIDPHAQAQLLCLCVGYDDARGVLERDLPRGCWAESLGRCRVHGSGVCGVCGVCGGWLDAAGQEEEEHHCARSL